MHRLLCLLAFLGSAGVAAGAETAVQSERWEEAPTKGINYSNPYKDVSLSVTYSEPGGASFSSYGFWDGGDVFKIRAPFPMRCAWTWRTACSDAANGGLHNNTGTVEASACAGGNPLYRRGLMAVSANKSFVTYGDGTPFLWMGDNAWGSDAAGLAG